MASEENEEILAPSPEAIEKVLNDVNKDVNKETGEAVEKFVDAVFTKGIPPRDALGLKPEMIEGLYGQAYRLYNTGNYKDATALFRLLVLLNVTDPKYTMGLASSMHMMKQYEPATQMYSVCSILDPGNPIPYYHCSDCWMKIGDPASALISLELAYNRAAENPEHKALQDRCEMMIKTLKKQLEEAGAFKTEEEIAAEKKAAEEEKAANEAKSEEK